MAAAGVEESKEEIDLVEESDKPLFPGRPVSYDHGPEELDEQRLMFCLRANPILETSSSEFLASEGYEGSVSSEATDGTDLAGKENGSNVEAYEKRKMRNIWASTARLGWTPGQVRNSDNKGVTRLEPVVALSDDLDGMSLGDDIVKAMKGKRGSFSSDFSVRTEESEDSKTKRARVWSVFRGRGGTGGSTRP